MPEAEGLPELHSLWIGKRLSWVERLSLSSWLRHRHRVKLWCYEPIEGVPIGTQLADAASILPKALITRHRRTGSFALFSDRFRYHLLQREPATWLDADVVLLRPLASTQPYLFAWEGPTSICTAVMRLPSGSSVLRDLTRLTDARVPIPPWWTPKEKLRQRLRGLRGRHERVEDMAWGAFGPTAFMYFLQRRGLADHALPSEVFYPVHWRDYLLFFATPDAVSPKLTQATLAVHLWSSKIKDRRNEPPPPTSWLSTICDRFEVDVGQ